MKTGRLIFLFLTMLAAAARAQTSWEAEFAKMPLVEKPAELNRHNAIRIMLDSFKRNPAVKALIVMPGATDEFYFFRRAHAKLTNAATLLDAVRALTNQTYIRATVNPPFLLLHTGEDSLEPTITVKDVSTAERLHKKHFEKHAVFNDRDWDYLQPMLSFDLDTKMWPGLYSHDSHHFFRHSFAEYDLNGWDALRAVALAGKSVFVVEKKRVSFLGDERVKPPAVPPTDEYLKDNN